MKKSTFEKFCAASRLVENYLHSCSQGKPVPDYLQAAIDRLQELGMDQGPISRDEAGARQLRKHLRLMGV